MKSLQLTLRSILTTQDTLINFIRFFAALHTQFSFAYRGSILWNSHLHVVKLSSSLNTFKLKGQHFFKVGLYDLQIAPKYFNCSRRLSALLPLATPAHNSPAQRFTTYSVVNRPKETAYFHGLKEVLPEKKIHSSIVRYNIIFSSPSKCRKNTVFIWT